MKNILLTLMAGACLAGCAPENRNAAIVPYPNDIVYGRGSYSVANRPLVVDERADERTRNALTEFASRLEMATGGSNPVVYSGEMPAKGIRFVIDETVADEGYKLDIDRRGVEVRASGFAGFLYAVQSIKQLLPVEIYGTAPAAEAEWNLPCLSIDDAPRFAYRGLHLDVSRHFFPVEEVKRYIDMMAVHKLNRLHWHLTDDQGWRVEIKRYPELTEKGSVRKQTVIRKEWDNYDGVPYGGYYTQEQIRDVVKYASDRGITIIPEIDLPGHMMAALATYPELGCTGGPYDVWQRWGISEEVLCAGNDKIFEFLEGVFEEIVELFPSEYVHIGGDECPKVRWHECPKCQARIRELGFKDDGKYSAEHYLQCYVMTRISKFLNGKGRRIIGWDEILEGEVAPDATVMSWRGNEGGIEAAKLGHDVIMVPTQYFYFDYLQSQDVDREPFGIGGYVPVEKVYSYEPPYEELTPEQQKHIIGIQANMWTEYIADADHLEYMLLPRLAALSEVQWCRPEVRDWERFIGTFRMDRIYSAMGYNFAKHIFGVSGSYEADTDKGCVMVSVSTQGDAPIYYTLDGSEPTPASSVYTGPVAIDHTCTFKAAALREGIDAPVYERSFAFNKATCRKVTLNAPASEKYAYAGGVTLVDGVVGSTTFAGGAWIGFLPEPMDVTIDMEGVEGYSQVTVTALSGKSDWIFPPSSIEVLTSDDGEHFTQAASMTVKPDGPTDPDDIRNYTLSFPETAARYLRVVATAEKSIPDWHPGKGRHSYLFVGEIAVE